MRHLRAVSLAAGLIGSVGCSTGDSTTDDDDGGVVVIDAGGRDAAVAVDAGPRPDGAAPSDAGPVECDRPIPNVTGQRITTDALNEPIFLAQPPGSSDLYVLERRGFIRIVRGGEVLDAPFLDITELTGGYGNTPGDERGLLGLAFHPEYAANGRFFVYFAATAGEARNVLAEGRRSATADRAEEDVTPILTIPDFAPNHNGGMIAFGRDGYLYVGTGDGGGGGDPERTAQNLGELLGKILRLDVDAAAPYVPASNPFVGTAGAEGVIWAYGLRNPWRWSFDRETGDLWIGDVGQDRWEEIDFQPASSMGGENYGWSVFEGTNEFARRPLRPGSVHTPPVYEYAQERDDTIPAAGESVTGGYVYRGSAIPELRGAYIFADLNGTAGAFRYCDGVVTNLRNLPGIESLSGRYVYSFAEDAAGELYIMYATGEVYRLVAE